jgi:phospholipid N-methyltransferase
VLAGGITRAILNALGPDGRLISFETNPAFVAWLRADLRDPRVQVIPQSAATVRAVLDTLKVPIADCILSGLPLQALPPPVTRSILAGVCASMGPQSQFAVFQYTARQKPLLREYFSVVRCVRRGWWNLPPARIYRCLLDGLPQAAEELRAV